MTIAVLGLGEAGRMFALGLAEHTQVIGFDPLVDTPPEGVELAATLGDCVREADAVLAFTPASHSAAALQSALVTARPGTIYADLATGSPEQKRQLAVAAAAGGLDFADAAIMSPVRLGYAATPVLVAGSPAVRLAEQLAGFGMQIEAIEGPAGAAAARKLLRSMLVKGMTGLMIESLRAAEQQDLLDWFSDHLETTLTTLTTDALRGFLSGTLVHAARRVGEMEAAAAMAEEGGGSAVMTRGTVEVLRSIAATGIPRSAPLL